MAQCEMDTCEALAVESDELVEESVCETVQDLADDFLDQMGIALTCWKTLKSSGKP